MSSPKLHFGVCINKCSIWKHSFIYQIIGILSALQAFYIAVTSDFHGIFPFTLPARSFCLKPFKKWKAECDTSLLAREQLQKVRAFIFLSFFICQAMCKQLYFLYCHLHNTASVNFFHSPSSSTNDYLR